MKLGELFFELGFKADTMKLKDFGKALGDLNMNSLKTAGLWAAVYEGAKAVIGIADEFALGVNKFGRETGQSREEIQKWNAVADQMGVQAGVVEGAIGTLEDSIYRMRFTGEGSNIWAMLGIDPTQTKDMFQVLTMLRNRMKDMDTETQRFFLNSLGLSTELLNIFKLTDQQWGDINKQQAINEEQLEKINEYHRINRQLGYDLKLIWVDIGTAIIPVVDSLAKAAHWVTSMTRDSWVWKGIMDTISEISSKAGSPGKLVKDVGWSFKAMGDMMQSQIKEMGLYDNPDYLKQGQMSAFNVSPKVTVNMRAEVKSNDPHTLVSIFQENQKAEMDNAVEDRPEGSY